MHDWVLLSSFHLFNDASQRCIKSLVGVATCRLAPLLCLFMEDAKTVREKKKERRSTWRCNSLQRKAASDVFTGHGRLTDSGLGWSHRHAFLQRCVKLRFSSIFLREGWQRGIFHWKKAHVWRLWEKGKQRSPELFMGAPECWHCAGYF